MSVSFFSFLFSISLFIFLFTLCILLSLGRYYSFFYLFHSVCLFLSLSLSSFFLSLYVCLFLLSFILLSLSLSLSLLLSLLFYLFLSFSVLFFTYLLLFRSFFLSLFLYARRLQGELPAAAAAPRSGCGPKGARPTFDLDLPRKGKPLDRANKNCSRSKSTCTGPAEGGRRQPSHWLIFKLPAAHWSEIIIENMAHLAPASNEAVQNLQARYGSFSGALIALFDLLPSNNFAKLNQSAKLFCQFTPVQNPVNIKKYAVAKLVRLYM